MKKTINRLLSLLLAALFLLPVGAPMFGIIVAAYDSLATVPAGFTGITTAAQLNNVRSNLNGKFILMANIDLSNMGNWIPIGSGYSTAFTGTLNGNGYKIVGMTVNASAQERIYGGLFGYILGGTVENLGIENSTVTITATESGSADVYAYAAAIAGSNDEGTIRNCYSKVTVMASSAAESSRVYVAGIAGENYNGTIEQCYNSGAVSATAGLGAFSGGITGVNYGDMSICFNTSSVTAISRGQDSCAGGITGYSKFDRIHDCFNTGNVAATAGASGVGGLSVQPQALGGSSNPAREISVLRPSDSQDHSGITIQAVVDAMATTGGLVGYSNNGQLATAYSASNSVSASAEYPYRGGVFGINEGSGVNTYFLNSTISQGSGYAYGTATDQTTGLTDAQMRNITSFPGFQGSIWHVDPSSTFRFPQLRQLPIDGSGGSSDDPLPIAKARLNVGFPPFVENYPEGKKGNYYDVDYSYYDSYFQSTSTTYNHALAKVSLTLALTAYGASWRDYQLGNMIKAENAVAMLSYMGYSDIEPYNYNSKPAPSANNCDTIACVFAHKKLPSGKQMIVIAVRGGEYEGEWGGNFNIGSGQIHKGFEIAKNTIRTQLNNYVAGCPALANGTSAQFWITGYSRGSAVANLLAAELDNDSKGGSLALGSKTLTTNRDNIFGYCFAVPNNSSKPIATADKDLYKNIFNICNPADFVPRVAPYAWGYFKYGNTYWLPADGDTLPKTGTGMFDGRYKYKDLKTEMLKEYGKLRNKWGKDLFTADQYWIDSFDEIDGNIHWLPTPIKVYATDPNGPDFMRMPLSKYLDQDIQPIAFEDLIPTKDIYVEQWQDTLIKTLWQFGVDSSKIDATDVMSNLLPGVLSAMADHYGGWGDLLTFLLKKAIGLRNMLATLWPSEEATPENIANWAKFVVHKSGKGYLRTMEEENVKALGQGHWPEVYLSWMSSLPSGYFDHYDQTKNIKYRKAVVNCPVDVRVYDSQGILVGSILNDIPWVLADVDISAEIDADGQKIFYLLASEDYDIQIAATGNGNMTYSISEYNRDVAGSARIVNYYELPISIGNKFEAQVPPKDADPEVVDYALYRDNGGTITKINPSEDLRDEAAKNAKYRVEVAVGDDNGLVAGGGVYEKGAYALLEASPNNGYAFDGWYINNSRVSSEMVYRFCVKQDVIVTAKFTALSTPATYTLTLNPNSGSVTPTSVIQATGTTYALPTPVRSGFTFTGWTLSGGGSLSGSTYTFGTSNGTVTAQWTANAATNYTLTINANGGSVTPTSVAQAAGTTYNLPTPTRSGYTFNGWLLSGGGNLSGNVYTFGTSNGTATAQWTAVQQTKKIFSTKYDATFLNWILFFICFGWIWMWF